MYPEQLERYNDLLRRIKREPVCDELRAVQLMRAGNWIGTGTLIVHPKKIITCEHLFPSSEKSDFLYYHEIQLKDCVGKLTKPIAQFVGDPKMDIGTCIPGKTAIIEHKSKFGNDGLVTETHQFFSFKEKPLLTNLLTGETVRGLGKVDTVDSSTIVIEYESLPCEGGSGFIDQEDNFLVLTKNVFIGEKIRELFSMGSNFSSVSFAISLRT